MRIVDAKVYICGNSFGVKGTSPPSPQPYNVAIHFHLSV